MKYVVKYNYPTKFSGVIFEIIFKNKQKADDFYKEKSESLIYEEVTIKEINDDIS